MCVPLSRRTRFADDLSAGGHRTIAQFLCFDERESDRLRRVPLKFASVVHVDRFDQHHPSPRGTGAVADCRRGRRRHARVLLALRSRASRARGATRLFCARFVITTHVYARCGSHVVTVSLRAACKRRAAMSPTSRVGRGLSRIGRRWAIDVRRASILVATTTPSRSRAPGAPRDNRRQGPLPARRRRPSSCETGPSHMTSAYGVVVNCPDCLARLCLACGSWL
jgi:hypothetical protein